jgi:NDP-sugar pyrophosphorylase family protein
MKRDRNALACTSKTNSNIVGQMGTKRPAAKTSLGDTWAMILAGGMGTRLRAAVADRPKVMALVLGRPFITFLLDRLAGAGIRNVVLCTGYRADHVKQELGNTYGPIRLVYSTEPAPLGTGGALALGATLCDSEHVLALNGDSYCSADLEHLWQRHLDRPARATIQLAHMPDTSRYGQVRVESDGHVAAFEEKRPNGGAGWINAGIYCLSRNVLERIAPATNVSIERDVFPSLIGHGLYAADGEAPLLDIGTPESYAQAAAFLAGLTTGPRVASST